MRENVDPTATADPGTPTLPSRASSHTVDRGRPRGRRPWLGTYGAAALLCAAWTAIAASLTLGGSGSPGPMMTAHPACVAMLAAGSQTVALESDGRPRDVIVHIPAAPTHQRWPAVVAFHGYSSFAMDLEVVSGLSALADDHGFVVAYPQALGSPTEWHFSGNLGGDQRDLSMTRALLRLLVDRACVDPDRIVLAGHSMGGGMASDAACRLADQVAGVVLVAALWFELPCQPARPLPVVAAHAVDDEVLPYQGGTIGGVAPGVPEQLPVESAIGTWAAHDGCASTPKESANGDGGAVLTWLGCDAPVVLHRLASGGHAWPALASQLIAEMATSG